VTAWLSLDDWHPRRILAQSPRLRIDKVIGVLAFVLGEQVEKQIAGMVPLPEGTVLGLVSNLLRNSANSKGSKGKTA